jgi:hypothetical protein
MDAFGFAKGSASEQTKRARHAQDSSAGQAIKGIISSSYISDLSTDKVCATFIELKWMV